MSDDLGGMLRVWRDRTAPAAVGLPSGGRRRSPGLRREELAMLAGVSVDYLTRLEQGRAAHPSAQVLQALGRSLQLTDAEVEHLFRLAGQSAPGPGRIKRRLTPGVQRLLQRLEDVPVAVSDAGWTTVAWNPMWAALMGDYSQLSDRERNTPWRHFTGLPSRVLHDGDEDAFQTSMVSDLRRVAAKYPDDEELRRLIADLRRVSPIFADLWDRHDVEPHVAARKTIRHSEVGLIEVDCDVLLVADTDLRIVAYTAAPGTEAADKLALVRVLGLQHVGAGSARTLARRV